MAKDLHNTEFANHDAANMFVKAPAATDSALTAALRNVHIS